jgi:uncharacterized protein YggE
MQPFRAVLLAAVLLYATPLAAQDMTPPARRSILTVSGEGIATAAPDLASFSTGVVTAAKTAREALDANTKSVADVVAAIKAAGVEPRDISTSGFSVQPQYVNVKRDGGEAPRIAGYEVRNTVTVRLRDLSKLGGLLDDVVTKGANQIGGIGFDIAEPSKLEEQARVAAVKDARRQAEVMAEAGGVRLVRVISINEDGATPPPMPRMMAVAQMAKRDSVPVEAGETEIRARVTIVYEIEPR